MEVREMMTSNKKFLLSTFFALFSFHVSGCVRSAESEQVPVPAPVTTSGVYSTEVETSLSKFVSDLRAGFQSSRGYEIEFTGDHGYRGEYLELSYNGVVVVDAMKIPMEKTEYALTVYELSSLPAGDRAVLRGLIKSHFGEKAIKKTGTP